MKICPRCKIEHNKKGTFCSRSCSNSRTFSKESKERKSKANKNYWSNLSEEQQKKILTKLKNASIVNQGLTIERLFESEFNDLTYQSRRKRVILEQEGKCLHCGIDRWKGEIISLELDHIDGNNKNDKRENLRALCPNCHSLTPTWRGRKGKVSTRKSTVKTQLDIMKNI